MIYFEVAQHLNAFYAISDIVLICNKDFHYDKIIYFAAPCFKYIQSKLKTEHFCES